MKRALSAPLGARTRRALYLGALGLLTTLSSTTAQAGAKSSAVVSIDTILRRATGGVASTRAYSALFDSDSYIGCWTSGGPTGAQAGCSAKRGGTTVSCTVDPAVTGKVQDFVWAMGVMGPSAYIEFTWNSSMRCQSLKVYMDSRYAPKAP